VPRGIEKPRTRGEQGEDSAEGRRFQGLAAFFLRPRGARPGGIRRARWKKIPRLSPGRAVRVPHPHRHRQVCAATLLG
jgi:hypothetical protein